jgi:hypothetical protein
MSKRSPSVQRALRAGLAGLTLAVTGASLSSACLDRPVAPAEPRTSNIFVDRIVNEAIDKIDLLFVIDNSISMADKQEILADAVPQLVNRLITPTEIDGVPEFEPVDDIHIGIVTSSLGGHGADICSPLMGDSYDPTMEDNGRLLGTIRPNPDPPFTTWNNSGFLAWDPTGLKKQPPGEANAGALVDNFRNMVRASGENGCGFEATLESWYRFLIDPDPPAGVIRDPANPDRAVINGFAEDIKAQRAVFLRPDSLVAIIMLTDENDCSVVDGGIGWLSSQQGGGFHIPRGTSACLQNPNSNCCRSCATQESAPPANCGPLGGDPECAKGVHDGVSDPLNLRCWEQKRRFGIDFLYPTDRYVEGLREPLVWNRAEPPVQVPNPLYSTGTTGAAPRSPGLVFLAGLVGVPWQDIATADTLNDPVQLRYLRANEIRDEGRWPWILGDLKTSPPTPPSDPLMVEQPAPRMGNNPATNAAVAPESSTDPQANPINGHEYNPNPLGDLQYACIFPLRASRDCTAGTRGCDCGTDDIPFNKPLCNPPGGGPAGTTQYFAKGYPGLRHLQVLKDFGDNSIVASICPKVVDPSRVPGGASDPNYGYNPAVAAIIDRLKAVLGIKCLPRQLAPQTNPEPPETFGQVPCKVVEALPLAATNNVCDCAAAGRKTLEPGDPLDAAVRKELAELQICGGSSVTGLGCNDYCLCEILQFTGDNLSQCQATKTASTAGYCYIDPSIGVGNPDLVKDCQPTEHRILQFVDDEATGIDTPQKGAVAFIACAGATFSTTGDGG